MAECECVDGEWGKPCPACGQRLPNPPKVTSWLSQRPLQFPSGSSAGLGERHMGYSRVPRSQLVRAGYHRP